MGVGGGGMGGLASNPGLSLVHTVHACAGSSPLSGEKSQWGGPAYLSQISTCKTVCTRPLFG